MYGSFLPVQSLSAAYSTGDKFARVFLCLKVSLILLLLVSMERIPWTNQEQDTSILPIPQSPGIYRREPPNPEGADNYNLTYFAQGRFYLKIFTCTWRVKKMFFLES